VEEPTGESNIVAIFNNYTDAVKACTHPILKFENFKPRLASTLSTYEINHRSVRIWDILNIFSRKISQQDLSNLMLLSISRCKKQDHTKDTTIRMFPYYYTREKRLERNEFSIKLTKFLDLITEQDLSDIMQQVGAKACYTSQTIEKFRRFTSLNFISHEDLTKATANDIDFKGHKLTWVARTAKLCYYCRDTQHMIANCNVKPLNNSRTKHRIQSESDLPHIKKENAIYKHMDEMEENTESTSDLISNSTSDSTISTTKQLIETEDIKTTQSLINKKLNKMEETMTQFAELFNNNLLDQNSLPDLTSFQQ
ncbi:9373_t:CDS:2, partial [Acaulospora morrowiae]